MLVDLSMLLCFSCSAINASRSVTRVLVVREEAMGMEVLMGFFGDEFDCFPGGECAAVLTGRTGD